MYVASTYTLQNACMQYYLALLNVATNEAVSCFQLMDSQGMKQYVYKHF